jgi:hypothetical protein
MYDIPVDEISREFGLCWQAAGHHLQTCGRKAAKEMKPELLMLPPGVGYEAIIWLKVELRPPFLEHLSFRLGNQLFFVRLEDVDNSLEIPGTRNGLMRVANECKGHACLMPMKRSGGKWKPTEPGWGLVSLPTPRFLTRNSDIGYGVHISGGHLGDDGEEYGFADDRDIVWEQGRSINPPNPSLQVIW